MTSPLWLYTSGMYDHPHAAPTSYIIALGPKAFSYKAAVKRCGPCTNIEAWRRNKYVDIPAPTNIAPTATFLPAASHRRNPVTEVAPAPISRPSGTTSHTLYWAFVTSNVVMRKLAIIVAKTPKTTTIINQSDDHKCLFLTRLTVVNMLALSRAIVLPKNSIDAEIETILAESPTNFNK